MILAAPKNPLVFPYGTAPGFDPSHLACGHAANAIRVAVVPGSGGAFINLLDGQRTTPARAGGTAHVTLQGPLGQAVYGGSDNNQRNSIAGIADAPGEFTTACIIHVVASTANGVLFTTNGVNTSGARQQLTLSGLLLSYTFQGSGFSTGISLVVGKSYFVAFSGRPLKQAVVVLDLATGQIQTFTDTDNITMSVGQATYAIGGQVFGTGTCGAHIYASMYGTKFLPLQSLLEWSRDPWAFWYPHQLPASLRIGESETENTSAEVTWPGARTRGKKRQITLAEVINLEQAEARRAAEKPLDAARDEPEPAQRPTEAKAVGSETLKSLIVLPDAPIEKIEAVPANKSLRQSRLEEEEMALLLALAN